MKKLRYREVIFGDEQRQDEMNKLRAKKRIIDYFKTNSIKYRFLHEDRKPMMLDSSDTVYMCVCIPDVIGGHIETSIRFQDAFLLEWIILRSFTKNIKQKVNPRKNFLVVQPDYYLEENVTHQMREWYI